MAQQFSDIKGFSYHKFYVYSLPSVAGSIFLPFGDVGATELFNNTLRDEGILFSSISASQSSGCAVSSVSDLDSDPCGSILKWLPWIRISIGNTDPDQGQSK